jgi:hypothetical protein
VNNTANTGTLKHSVSYNGLSRSSPSRFFLGLETCAFATQRFVEGLDGETSTSGFSKESPGMVGRAA